MLRTPRLHAHNSPSTDQHVEPAQEACPLWSPLAPVVSQLVTSIGAEVSPLRTYIAEAPAELCVAEESTASETLVMAGPDVADTAVDKVDTVNTLERSDHTVASVTLENSSCISEDLPGDWSGGWGLAHKKTLYCYEDDVAGWPSHATSFCPDAQPVPSTVWRLKSDASPALFVHPVGGVQDVQPQPQPRVVVHRDRSSRQHMNANFYSYCLTRGVVQEYMLPPWLHAAWTAVPPDEW
ncbi:hypothetical protein SeMB42_g05098 [Synchytrium endobioticum]|uniref:Uncharacterized protein n=1 Tax=Synchytrium endobioticum TaxID=286115 RepID=A0A507CTZ9_9FUNG|nr:hypothetical protein SeMB42_g05098 [Synchytrium endobioticum]